jgi:CheY-like chemotaxis protein
MVSTRSQRAGSVLVIEDDIEFGSFVATVLAQTGGHHVRLARDGAEGIAMVDVSPPDVVVTDLTLPIVDGAGVIAHLASHHPRVSVVAMTALEDVSAFAGLSGCRVLRKPFSSALLLKSVDAELLAVDGVRGVTLAGLLQLLALEKSNVLVRVRGTTSGSVRLRHGLLADAVHGVDRGVAALRSLLLLEMPGLLVEQDGGPTGLNIVLEHALLDTLRRSDESSVGMDAPRDVEFFDVGDLSSSEGAAFVSADYALMQAVEWALDSCTMVAVVGRHQQAVVHVIRGDKKRGRAWATAIDAMWGTAQKQGAGEPVEMLTAQTTHHLELVMPVVVEGESAAVAALVERRGTNMGAAMIQLMDALASLKA